MSDGELRLLVVQHSPAENLGAFGRVLSQQGGKAQVVHSYAGESVPESPEGYDGLVLMGGPMGVYEQDRYPFLGDEVHLLEAAFRRGLPVLGVCLGSQLIARALGTKVEPGRAKEIGWYRVRLSEEGREDALLGRLPGEFMAFHWHGDVFEVPADAVRLAESDLTPAQAFRYGTNVYGLLFHLEMTPDIASAMVKDFSVELDEAGVSGKAVLDGFSRYGETLGELARSFFGGWLGLVRGRAQSSRD